jgi:hypothetical protein
MKRFNYFKLIFTLFALAFSLSNFGQEKPMNSQFKSPQEAANQGKADLLAVLKSGRDLNIGVTAEQLEKASAGKEITRRTLKFEKILNLENTKSLRETESELVNTVVPLMLDGKVITVIDVKQTNEGWVVSGLGGMSLSNDLSTVLAASKNADVIIYDVPNLQSIIYTVVVNGEEVYYSTLSEKQSLRTATTREVMFPILQAEARAFQEEWGDKLKEGKLVR